MMLSTLALAFAAQAAAAAPAPAPIPGLAEARRQIVARDAALFWAAFEACDTAALEPILAPEFRMLHDRGGLVADSREAFLASEAAQCAERAPGGEHEGYRNRRLAVPGSRIVRPLGDWGVLEEGSHVFFERRADGSWELVGGARYMNAWKWMPEEGAFRLVESLSYDHGAATPYPPAQPEPAAARPEPGAPYH